ncbi:MAG: hypothetical protein M1820_006271 [Bogoriella megaspora]|nr:MAG: hypothetical protein M1820_006271 [Bogoriella megaspora]
MAVELRRDLSLAQTRTTRIVCVSDTHNSSPKHGGWKLPKGDILIHAGDLTNQGTFSELQKTVQWIEDAPYENKIVIAGNHDITLDTEFYARNWQSFHNKGRQDAQTCRNLLTESSSIAYLENSTAQIDLSSSTNLHTQLSIFGSPFVPSRGLWAFGYDHTATTMWDNIPTETDIVVTHTPPKGFCDKSPKWGDEAGCPQLTAALARVKPLLAVCGHCHEGRGAARVEWVSNQGNSIVRNEAEKMTEPQFKATEVPLQSNGAGNQLKIPVDGCDLNKGKQASRLNDTYVVNAAIVATSHGIKPKRFNQPIVIDIDLPTYVDN